MTSNKLEVLLMKVLLFISYYFLKKQIVSPFAIKDTKKHLLMKVSIKIFLEIHMKRIKISLTQDKKLNCILLEHILDIFKCLILWLVHLKFGNSTIFIYFSWCPLWIWYGATWVHSTVPSGKRGALLFLWAHIYTFSNTFIKQIWNFSCHYITISRLLLNWKKHKQGIQLFYVYDAYNQTK